MNTKAPLLPPAKGNQIHLIHLENRIRRVRLLAEQAALVEENGRVKRDSSSSSHATKEEKGKVKGRKGPQSSTSTLIRPSRPSTNIVRKEQPRDRSKSAKPTVRPEQPSTSKTVSTEKKPAPKTVGQTTMSKDKETSPYARQLNGSPASSTDASVQRLMDEMKRLKEENKTLRRKVDADLTKTEDLAEWPRRDLLKLIAQLESQKVRKPVQAAVRKLHDMGDQTTLQEQLKLARDAVQQLKEQNQLLQEQLEEAKEVVYKKPIIPRLAMPDSGSSGDFPDENGHDDYNVNSDGDEYGYPEEGADEDEASSELARIMDPPSATDDDKAGIITDPALMTRYDYEQIACDIVHATRAHILRKRFMDKWRRDKGEHEDNEE